MGESPSSRAGPGGIGLATAQAFVRESAHVFIHIRPGASIIPNALIVGSKGFVNWSVYSATKAAVGSFAKTWASDLEGRNIRVNTITRGVIETPGDGTVGMSAANLEGYFGVIKTLTPLQRNGTPDDVASVATSLASDESRVLTGSEVSVDDSFAQI